PAIGSDGSRARRSRPPASARPRSSRRSGAAACPWATRIAKAPARRRPSPQRRARGSPARRRGAAQGSFRKPHIERLMSAASFARTSWRPEWSAASERNVVVHVTVARARSGRDAARRRARRTAGAEIAARLVGEAATATTAATAIKHRQRRVEALQHDFGGVFLDTGLVGPFARLQRTLDINLGALFQILLGDFAEPLIEDHDPMPFGLFLALAGRLVAPALRGRDAQIGDRPAVLGTPDLRVLAEIADQNHLVHTSRHRHSPR